MWNTLLREHGWIAGNSVTKTIWIAVIAPGDARRGEIDGDPALYQNQIAATMMDAFGFDYGKAVPQAGKAIALPATP